MGYIFESEIETIMNTVRARTIGEADTITLRKILRSDIHPAIKAYFRSEVEKQLIEARRQEVRSKNFPYSLPEVVSLQRQIDVMLVHQYQFDQTEFEVLVDQSVHFHFNYLCRPQWTLLNFMFEDRRRISTSEVLRKLRYCADFRYFPRVLQRYIGDRGLAEIEYSEFKSLVKKIDDAILEHHSAADLAKLTRPLIVFLEMGIPNTQFAMGEATLPINAAIVFFEDKHMVELKEKLEEERDRNEVDHVTVDQLAKLITKHVGPLPKASEGEDPSDGPPEVAAGSITPDVEEDGEEVFEKAPEEDESVVVPEEMPDPLPDSATRVDHSPHTATASRQPDKLLPELPEVHSLFEEHEIKVFTKRIFRKDSVEFRNALDRLNAAMSWLEASLLLDQIFLENDVDPFSKEAIRFTNKVYSRYQLPDQPGGLV
jgi:hypothetical protein